MFRPRESSTKRIARFVIRTHAVPAIASTNGNAISAAAISAMAIHLAAGFFFRSASVAKSLDRPLGPVADALAEQADRKSTRLNSSHITISYAVFCLKKKKKKKTINNKKKKKKKKKKKNKTIKKK